MVVFSLINTLSLCSSSYKFCNSSKPILTHINSRSHWAWWPSSVTRCSRAEEDSSPVWTSGRHPTCRIFDIARWQNVGLYTSLKRTCSQYALVRRGLSPRDNLLSRWIFIRIPLILLDWTHWYVCDIFIVDGSKSLGTSKRRILNSHGTWQVIGFPDQLGPPINKMCLKSRNKVNNIILRSCG